MFALVLFKNDKFRWPHTLFNMLKFGKKRAWHESVNFICDGVRFIRRNIYALDVQFFWVI